MLNGLDLFSGIGGISYALRDYVRPVAYCESDSYCQGILLSRMAKHFITIAPIWDDIRKFPEGAFRGAVDIIYGGFPCQGISVAGHGKGLADERSGLFWEIVHLSKKIKPKFIFLENVPAITSQGGLTVVRAITEMGYDCRWCTISAASIGALHRRERWFLLAYYNSERRRIQSVEAKRENTSYFINDGEKRSSTNSDLQGSQFPSRSEKKQSESWMGNKKCYWSEVEPPVWGVDDGISCRLDRIRGLGNAVVPQQAKEAFEILMGIKK